MHIGHAACTHVSVRQTNWLIFLWASSYILVHNPMQLSSYLVQSISMELQVTCTYIPVVHTCLCVDWFVNVFNYKCSFIHNYMHNYICSFVRNYVHNNVSNYSLVFCSYVDCNRNYTVITSVITYDYITLTFFALYHMCFSPPFYK